MVTRLESAALRAPSVQQGSFFDDKENIQPSVLSIARRERGHEEDPDHVAYQLSTHTHATLDISKNTPSLLIPILPPSRFSTSDADTETDPTILRSNPIRPQPHLREPIHFPAPSDSIRILPTAPTSRSSTSLPGGGTTTLPTTRSPPLSVPQQTQPKFTNVSPTF